MVQHHGDDDTSRSTTDREGAESRERRGERLTVPRSRHVGPVKEYVGLVWIGDEPGIRIRVMAEEAQQAGRFVHDHFGEGHVVSLWTEQDAHRLR